VDIRSGGWVVGLLCLLLLLWLAWDGSPRGIAGIEYGHVDGVHHVQREDGPPTRRLRVRLDSGAYVSVYLPMAVIYRADARVELRVWKRDWFPNSKTYEFVRYTPDERAMLRPLRQSSFSASVLNSSGTERGPPSRAEA
jgi:hypothetical protein